MFMRDMILIWLKHRLHFVAEKFSLVHQLLKSGQLYRRAKELGAFMWHITALQTTFVLGFQVLAH